MSNLRIIPCECCQTEGRIYRGQYEDERDYGQCPVCEGTGGEVIETEPVTLDDMCCSDCGARINPMLYPCLEQTCPQRALSTSNRSES